MATLSSKKAQRRVASLTDELAAASVEMERNHTILLDNQKKIAARMDALAGKQDEILAAMEEMNFRITFMLMRSTFVIRQKGSLLSLTPGKTTTMSGWELLAIEREQIQRDIIAVLQKEADEDGTSSSQPGTGEAGTPGDAPAGDQDAEEPAGAGDAIPAGARGDGRLEPEAGDAEETRH